ncbi:MAG: PIN domain-containing protein [Candidatus Woesearchaeota archaeon]
MPYFYDTYAIIEVIRGNSNYDQYLDDEIITSNLNLGELFYSIIREHNEEKAEKWMEILKEHAFEVDSETIIDAMKFKFKYRKTNFSYIDCIGYIMAKKHGIKFLTGDKEFEKIDNVEFVK